MKQQTMKQQTTDPDTNNVDCHTNDGAGFIVNRNDSAKHLLYRPRLTKEDKLLLIEAKIRDEINLDEFRLKMRLRKSQAYKVLREFKDSEEYIHLCEDEWDRMTFSKEFNNSIPATVRYNNLTKVKCQLLSNKGSVIVDESKLKENEYRIIKALNAIHAELSP